MSKQEIAAIRRSHLSQVAPAEPRCEPGAAESAPIIELQELLFKDATSSDASDVHIEPRPSGTSVRYRVNGLMKDAMQLPRWMHDSLVTRIKVLAGLDISEHRVPQDGQIAASMPEAPDFRVSVLPSRAGEKVVLRLLRHNQVPKSLPDLHLDGEVEAALRALIHRPQGIITVVGPTGSGKTTTLYSLVNEVSNGPLNIVTIEDPVEYTLDRITQVQVNQKAGLTFARALRAILRQDPDVILVGEIRDGETARTAYEAAMTGHLVLTTLHTTDCVSAVGRLSELGVTRELIASGTAAVIAQRLVRENCPDCSGPDEADPTFLERLEIDAEAGRLQRGEGCASCDFTGVRGRTGLYEIMEVRGAIRNALLDGSESNLRRLLRANRVLTLTDQARGRALNGTVSVAEAYRTCYFGGEADG